VQRDDITKQGCRYEAWARSSIVARINTKIRIFGMSEGYVYVGRDVSRHIAIVRFRKKDGKMSDVCKPYRRGAVVLHAPA